MRTAALVDDLLIAGLARAVQHVAAGAGIGVAKAEHELAGLVHVIEHDAGRSVLVGERARAGIGIRMCAAGNGCESRPEAESERRYAGATT